ncbi:MAG: hypothetical protein ABFD65_01760 [Candidatus Polarisedimenticolia bacterium]
MTFVAILSAVVVLGCAAAALAWLDRRSAAWPRWAAVAADAATPLLIGAAAWLAAPRSWTDLVRGRSLIEWAVLLLMVGVALRGRRLWPRVGITLAAVCLFAFVPAAITGRVLSLLALCGVPFELNRWFRARAPHRPFLTVLGAMALPVVVILALEAVQGLPLELTVAAVAWGEIACLLLLRRSGWVQAGIVVAFLALIFFFGLGSQPANGVLIALSAPGPRVPWVLSAFAAIACFFALRRAGWKTPRWAVAAAALCLVAALAGIAAPSAARTEWTTRDVDVVLDARVGPTGRLLMNVAPVHDVGWAVLASERGGASLAALTSRPGRAALAPDGGAFLWIEYPRALPALWAALRGRSVEDASRRSLIFVGEVAAGRAADERRAADEGRAADAGREADAAAPPADAILGPRGSWLAIEEGEAALRSPLGRSLTLRGAVRDACFDERNAYALLAREVAVIDVETLQRREYPLETSPSGGWRLSCGPGPRGAWLVAAAPNERDPESPWTVVPLGPEGPGLGLTGRGAAIFLRRDDDGLSWIEAAAPPEHVGYQSRPLFGRRCGGRVVAGDASRWYELRDGRLVDLAAPRRPAPEQRLGFSWRFFGRRRPAADRRECPYLFGRPQFLDDSVVYLSGGSKVCRYWPAEERAEALFELPPRPFAWWR